MRLVCAVAIAIWTWMGISFVSSLSLMPRSSGKPSMRIDTDDALYPPMALPIPREDGVNREDLQSRQDFIRAASGAVGMAAATCSFPSNCQANDEKVIVQKNMPDPPPLLSIRGAARSGIGGAPRISMPRVGYSLYKTAPDQAARCTALALLAGVKYFDLASDYDSNPQVAKAIQVYLDGGEDSVESMLRKQDEKEELLARLKLTRKIGEEHGRAIVSVGNGASRLPSITGSAGRKGRRDSLFLSHKVANSEQSENPIDVKRHVIRAMKDLGVSYLDMVSIHSPLTDKARRIGTYRALLEMRQAGLVHAVGVCNFGIGALSEIEAAFGNKEDFPSMNQLEISPFNAHKDIVDFCSIRDCIIGCASWSKLSSSPDIVEGWDKLGAIANQKGMTKAQVLVRWAMQKGYACVPRSAPSSKVERIAIAQNSYGGVNTGKSGSPDASFVLSTEEMTLLDGLDVGFKSGILGRRDGWADKDVEGTSWDPTEVLP